LLIIYLILKYGLTKNKEFKLTEYEVNKIIDDFEPEEIIELNFKEILTYEEKKYELADYDVFNLKNKHRNEIKEIIKKYGIGTCGPRGFYGTLDLHLEIENKISSHYKRESAVLYPNAMTCISSVIGCFCKSSDVIFYHKDSNPSILRGIEITKSKSIEFNNLIDLQDKIKLHLSKNSNNFIILEGIYEMTGDILQLNEFIKIREQFKIRIILDESLSFPFLGENGIFSYYNADVNDVDIIIGSFAHYLCSNGGFVISDRTLAEYQRLASSSYCFSASLPAVLTKFNYLNLEGKFNSSKINELNKGFIDIFKHSALKIISQHSSPFILIGSKEEVSKQVNIKIIKYLRDELLNRGIRVGINEYPIYS
ncbi:hypothetical protein H311_04244, partial [Anncaliia algerae PRA109]